MYDTAPRRKMALLVEDADEQAVRKRRPVRRERTSRFMKKRGRILKNSVATDIPQRRGTGVAIRSIRSGDSKSI
jgi:hypothetical protein